MEKQIKELIESKRPNLSPSSVKTYGSILKSIYYMAFDSDTFKASNFDNIPAVMKALKDVNPKTRKTYLSALFIITEEPAYKNQMIDDIDEYNDDENKSIDNSNNDITYGKCICPLCRKKYERK